MQPRRVHNEVLECCNYKRCPRLEIFDDGSAILSDDDNEAGSVGMIKLRPEVAARLLELLSANKKEA